MAADPQNVQYLKIAPEKLPVAVELLLQQVLPHKELIARGGYLAQSWKTHRGKRLGPYYRLEFWDHGARRKIYIGRDPQRVACAKFLLEKLKPPVREKRLLRRARAAALASFRQCLTETDKLLESTPFYRRGTRFCKRRKLPSVQ